MNERASYALVQLSGTLTKTAKRRPTQTDHAAWQAR
jgi:hypothetical protein